MSKAQHAILRFAKYKGPTVSRIEAHNERTKESYASNPDIKTDLSKHNFHPVIPDGKYRDISNRIIREAGCRVRKDSVTAVEVLITASPEFFEKKNRKEVREFFDYAVEFMKSKQNPTTFISAVVHVDEKTPHMHLCFVPITADGRLSAKEIIGNKKRLTQWQDDFWSYMVKKYPDFERGESASLTGRTHIPPRLFKQAARLTRQKDKLMELISEMNALNAKAKSKEIAALLDEYIPGVEELMTKLKKTSKVAKMERIKFKKEMLLEMRTDGEITKQEFLDQRKKLDKELQELQAEYDSKAHNPVIEMDQPEWGKIQTTLEEILDLSQPIPSPDLIRKFVAQIVPEGKTNFQWHLNLDGNQTTHVGMTVEGRKNKAVVSFAAEGTRSPLAFGAVIEYPTLCRAASDKNAYLSAMQDRLLSRAKEKSISSNLRFG